MGFHASINVHRSSSSANRIVAFLILTDFVCALLPLAFIRKINRPLREKIILAFLMALGLFASACGIVKIALLKNMQYSNDPTFDAASISVWA
jgi:hypothetical protein